MKTLSTLALITFFGTATSTFAGTSDDAKVDKFFATSGTLVSQSANTGLQYAPPQQPTTPAGFTPYQPPTTNPAGFMPPGQPTGFTPQNVSFTQPNTYVPSYQAPQPTYQMVKLGFNGTMLYGQGLRVDSIKPGQSAEMIGLAPGDLLTHIGGQEILSFDHYLQLLQMAAGSSSGLIDLRYKTGRPCTGSPFRTLTFRIGEQLNGEG